MGAQPARARLSGRMPALSFPNHPAYLGIPFDDDDRGRAGLFCYALGRLILREELSIDPGDYGPAKVWHENAARIRAGKSAGDWIDVTAGPWRPFDFVVYAIGRIDDHLGVVVDDRWMMHVQRNDQSRLDEIRDARFGRLSGVFRHRALA